MDYVVGSVAALISGNVTPNRPKLMRRALTPTKHPASPNVTPKSELVDDRSIFLSPSVQKKKAIVKKSPKRIFQNPDLDVTSETENSSPKADKVKKHLKGDLDSDNSFNNSESRSKKHKSSNPSSNTFVVEEMDSPQKVNENTPKKKKKKNRGNKDEDTSTAKLETLGKSPEKKIKLAPLLDSNINEEEVNIETEKSSKKNKSTVSEETATETDKSEVKGLNQEAKSLKKKIKKKKKSHQQIESTNTEDINQETTATKEQTEKSKNKKSKKKSNPNYVNPNAITTKDSDSEHESDNEIVSENEETNKEILDTGPAEESSDEEDAPKPKKKEEDVEKVTQIRMEEEIKRTLFVGNVPFSARCKKEVKNIFSKYGEIETVRIRTVPVKDARMTPKLAVIKSELHPERSTVNVYVKFKDPASVNQALVENNTVLNNCHLRVTRSDSTGAEHDPRCAVFVGNVPFAMEDDALRETFQGCGEIDSVRIIRDKKTNAGKGFAYVNFASKDGVELALAMPEEDLTIKNRILRVKRCTQLTHRQKNNQAGKKKEFPANKGPQGGRVQGKGQFGKGFKKGKPNQEGVGAFRRIMNKRQHQDSNEGPPSKKQNINQPNREKKVRKEFVGMTAEKKKKHTFDKAHKKKKALSEILSKKFVS